MHSLYVLACPEKKRKNIDTMHRVYVFVSEGGGGGGGEGVEEKRLVFVSK